MKELQPLMLPCPRCGEANACFLISLAALGACPFICRECDTEFSAQDVQEIIDRWTPILAWLNQVPQPQPVEASEVM